MKPTVPFPRQFGPGDEGVDCRAVKRALATYFKNPSGMNLKTDTFAEAGQEALVLFKRANLLLSDPVYTSQAHQPLIPYFDEFGASLMVKETAILAAQRARAAYVATHRWFIAHAGLVRYAMVRPVPENLTPFETTMEILTDCSGLIELAARWTPGCPDPSRLGFNGQGNTGSLLAACTKIEIEAVLPGDLGWFGRDANDEYGEHAITFLDRVSADDFDVSSNGYIGDPIAHRFSGVRQALADSGYPYVRFLRFLPVP